MSGPDKSQSFRIGQTEGTYTAMINISISFDDLAESQNGKNLMKALTGTLKTVVPMIEANSGRVIRVSGSGISAVFENNAEDALICGISICQHFSSSKETDDEFRVFVGATYGKMFISDVVCGSFSAIVAVSDALDLTCLLSGACERADASLLITENLASHVIGFKNRFASRKIGLVYNPAEKKAYTVYDVFDGDSTGKKYSKRRSKLLFETGVEHFLSDRSLQARSCFIELLKYDRSDKVAKKYIRMCDKAISGGSENTEDKYLGVL